MVAEALLSHGGALREAARRWAIPLQHWLDLSTGINPRGWPVPPLPLACWQRLPEEEDGLETAARGYYGAAHLLPVAGSQAAIQLLPQLRERCRIGVLSPAYAEHAAAWRRAGHELVSLTHERIEAALPGLDVLLLINPNNPTGECFAAEALRAWHARLAARGGWLVVDEAFADGAAGDSLAADSGAPGLIVLRSLGKFFGLAGARVGFVLAWPALLQALRYRLGPWTLSGPAREVARMALEDVAWQRQTRAALGRDAARLATLLRQHGLPPSGGSTLFQYCPTAQATAIHQAMARQGILLRHFDAPKALRVGLPGSEEAWQRLARGLATCRR